MANVKSLLPIQLNTKPALKLEGLDLAGLSLEGLAITEITDARNLPEMGASSGSSSCGSTSCCGSSSCCIDVADSI